MYDLKTLWYKLVARDLLFCYNVSRNDIEQHRSSLSNWQREYSLLLKQLKEVQQENRSLRNQIDQFNSNPLGPVLDAARHHAAQQRIRDLESQLRKNNIEPQ
jgi:predicted RNase H-like nuclease (RuvC/YqgF family)